MEQQVKDLRPDGNRLGAAREFPALGIKHVVLKRELHLRPSQIANARVGHAWADAVSPGKE